MLINFLISIVFIAEIIITLTIIINLVKLDKRIIEFNDFVEDAKPDIKDIMKELEKLSEQLIELAPVFRDKIKSTVTNIIMSQLKSLLGGLTFWIVKKEVEKHVQ